ncbi:MAG: two-component regulator propeller domain-containing protein [Nitrospinota bacterium]
MVKMYFSFFVAFLAIFLSITPLPAAEVPADHPQFKVNSIEYDLDVRNVKALKFHGDLLYAGTPAGFYKYNIKTKEVDFFDYDNGLISRTIFSFTVDPDQETVWVGTYGGGLARFRGEDIKIFNVPDGLCDPFVYDAEFDKSGNMWIATWSGANMVSGEIEARKNWKKYTVENTDGGLSDNWVYAIEVDSKGRVWFGTERGISVFDGKNWKNWNHLDGMGAPIELVKKENEKVMSPLKGSHHASQLSGLSSLRGVTSNYNPDYVVSMAIDKTDTLWIGTWGGGLAKFDTLKEEFVNYTVADGLPGNYVLAIAFDKKGVMWLGSNNGLSKMQKNSFVTYDEKDGLFSQFIFSIAFSESDSMWLGGWKGVSNVLSIKD